MEVVQGLLSSGALERGEAVPEPTAEELRARSVGMRAILESLDLGLAPGVVEAELEARVGCAQRLAVERAVAWEIEDEIARKTGKEGSDARAELSGALDALEAKLEAVGGWLSRGGVARVASDDAARSAPRASLV